MRSTPLFIALAITALVFACGCRSPVAQYQASPRAAGSFVMTDTNGNVVNPTNNLLWSAPSNVAAISNLVADAGFGSGSGVSDGDKGDITVSGSGATWTVDSGAVPISELGSGTSAELAGKISDETGSGALVFAGGAIGAATATTPAGGDNDTSVATTAFVQGELASVSGGSSWFDDVEVANPNFDSTAFGRYFISGTNATYLPTSHGVASGTSATPDASVSDEFVYTMTGSFTLNAISNTSTNHAKRGIEITLIQGGSGGYQVTFATNFLFNDRYPGATIVWTNVGYRCLLRVKPRRDQPAVYDVTDFIDGMIP